MSISEYQVTVYTTVREIYYVYAESAGEAREVWPDGELDQSECVSVDEVAVGYVDQ